MFETLESLDVSVAHAVAAAAAAVVAAAAASTAAAGDATAVAGVAVSVHVGVGVAPVAVEASSGLASDMPAACCHQTRRELVGTWTRHDRPSSCESGDAGNIVDGVGCRGGSAAQAPGGGVPAQRPARRC